jgi:hypothetical protein
MPGGNTRFVSARECGGKPFHVEQTEDRGAPSAMDGGDI